MSEEPVQPAPSLNTLMDNATKWAIMAARCSELADLAKADLDAELLRRHADDNVKSAQTLIDRKPVVTWSVKEPQPKAIVGDDEAFCAYLEEHHPTEVEWVPKPNPAFVKVLLKRAVRDKANDCMVDPLSGQVIPGLTWIPAPPPSTVTPTWKKDGKLVVFEALRMGAAAGLLASALELPAAATDSGEAQS